MIHSIKKALIFILYKLIYLIEKIEYINKDLNENDISKKIIDTIELDNKELYVKSDSGYVPVSHIHLTQPYRHYNIELENGYKISCADNHILFDKYLNQIYAKDLTTDDYLFTDDNIQRVVSIKRSKIKTSMGDLTIDHPDHRYYTNGILSHNTITSAIYILHYMIFNNSKNILIAANKFDTAVEIMDKVKDIYMNLPFFLKPGVKVWNARTVKFQNKCKMKAFTMTKTSSIGNTADFVYLDEFAYIPNTIAEAFYKSIQPTLVSVENSKMIITSTPNGINLFQKLLMNAERDESDPLYNGFGSKRVYWHQIPGRNMTFIKLKPIEMAKYNIDKDFILNLCKETFDKNNMRDVNGIPFVSHKIDPHSNKHVIKILNRESLTKNDILKLRFNCNKADNVPISAVADISTWKEDAIKEIGSIEAFNQEYDLRFINTSKSIFTEETIKRIEENSCEFVHRPHQVFDSKLRWDYTGLKWIDDDSIFNEANRDKVKGIMSVDVSEGLGLDYSVINIFQIVPKSKELMEEQKENYKTILDYFQLEQIGIFRSNVVSVDELAEMIYLLGFEYFNEDNFKIVLEINNHGLAVLSNMKSVFDEKNNYGSHIFMRFKHRQDSPKKKIGLKVGAGNKKLMVKDYQELIERENIVVYETNTVKEISTFIKNVSPSGNVKYEADGGMTDDIIMSIVDMTTVFKDNIFKDMVEEVLHELSSTDIGKYINEHMKNNDYSEGNDYSSLINVNRQRRAMKSYGNNRNKRGNVGF